MRLNRYKDDKFTMNYYQYANDLTNLKKSFKWLTKVHSTSLQSSLRNLESAYQNFFRDKIGWIKCKISRKVDGKILNATISQSKSGKYYVSLCCEIDDIPQFKPTGKKIGIDLGLKSFLITSDG